MAFGTSPYREWGDFSPGSHVYTMDGDDLGTVKEFQGRYFKVDAPMKPDFWLSADCIRTASAGRVDVGFDKDHLSDYKVDTPPTA